MIGEDGVEYAGKKEGITLPYFRRQ